LHHAVDENSYDARVPHVWPVLPDVGTFGFGLSEDFGLVDAARIAVEERPLRAA